MTTSQFSLRHAILQGKVEKFPPKFKQSWQTTHNSVQVQIMFRSTVKKGGSPFKILHKILPVPFEVGTIVFWFFFKLCVSQTGNSGGEHTLTLCSVCAGLDQHSLQALSVLFIWKPNSIIVYWALVKLYPPCYECCVNPDCRFSSPYNLESTLHFFNQATGPKPKITKDSLSAKKKSDKICHYTVYAIVQNLHVLQLHILRRFHNILLLYVMDENIFPPYWAR